MKGLWYAVDWFYGILQTAFGLLYLWVGFGGVPPSYYHEWLTGEGALAMASLAGAYFFWMLMKERRDPAPKIRSSAVCGLH